uniref:Uncharacterized protein n=1 Tax=Romanomermis culicivorax TaxID=13658 RepID=A0A915K4S8_ROMCU
MLKKACPEFSAACRTQWTQIKSQLCTCTKNAISTKSAVLQAQLQACFTVENIGSEMIPILANVWYLISMAG